jgi:hypothetical protein
MTEFDFSKYSLGLFFNDELVFSSNNKGLKPLLICINECMDKYSECILYDKVIGLAAAKLIIYSRMISRVVTPMISKSALELLEKNDIEVKSEIIVENILNNDMSSVCPMEKRANKIDDNHEFYDVLKKLFLLI